MDFGSNFDSKLQVESANFSKKNNSFKVICSFLNDCFKNWLTDTGFE